MKLGKKFESGSHIKPLSITNEEIHVWCIENDPTFLSEDWMQGLTVDEQNRALSFVYKKHRYLWVRARVLIKSILMRYSSHSVEIDTDEKGKPFLVKSQGLKFNISHTEGYSVLAVSRDRELGVDIEKRQSPESFAESVAKNFFSQLEQKWLGKNPQKFYDLWTMKEALLKATGEGITQLDKAFLNPVLREAIDPSIAERWKLQRVSLLDEVEAHIAYEDISFNPPHIIKKYFDESFGEKIPVWDKRIAL